MITARFSLDDKYSRQRILLKNQFGLLLTKQPTSKVSNLRGSSTDILFCYGVSKFDAFFMLKSVICCDVVDEAENNTSKSHGPRTLIMAPAQQEETILVEGTGVVPAKCSPKIKSELFSLL